MAQARDKVVEEVKYRGSIRLMTTETTKTSHTGDFQKGDVYITNTRIRLIFNGEAWDYDRDLKVHK